LYGQMVRWGQAPLSAELLSAAKLVFRPDLYDAAMADSKPDLEGEPADGIGAFAGPAFDASDIAAHVRSWKIRRVLCSILDFALHKVFACCFPGGRSRVSHSNAGIRSGGLSD